MRPFIEDGEDIRVTNSCVIDEEIEETIGVVTSNVTMGRNVGKDLLAGFRDFFGGRSRSWEKSLQSGQKQAIEELLDEAREAGADTVMALSLEDEAVGNGNMMNIKATGTAVKTEYVDVTS